MSIQLVILPRMFPVPAKTPRSSYLRCAQVVFLLTLCLSGLKAEEGTGKIAVAYYREAPGSTLEDLKKVPAFPAQPTEQLTIDKFELPEDQPNNFATLIRGFVHPPETAEYTFGIACDDQGALYLSPSDDPSKKVKIAEVPAWSIPKKYDQAPEQISKPVKLEAGKKYYIEVVHKDGGGDNNCSVAWAWGANKLEKPIEGKFLSPAAELAVPPPKVTFDPKAPLPEKAGVHRIVVDVEYRAKHFDVPVLLTLPEGFAPKSPTAKTWPVLVYMHEGDEGPPADGYRIQGPDKELAKNETLKKKYPYIGISPQFSKQGNWSQKTVISAVDAAIGALIEHYPAEARKVYLTGRDMGGTAVWALAAESPARYSAIMPVCGYWKNTAPEVIEKFKTIPMFIIAGAKNGLASDSAKAMSEALKGAPNLEGVEYGMDETGKEPKYGSEIADKIYADDYFWGWMFSKAKPGPKVAKTGTKKAATSAESAAVAAYAGPNSFWLSVGLMGVAAFMIIVGFYFAAQSKQLVKVSSRSEE